MQVVDAEARAQGRPSEKERSGGPSAVGRQVALLLVAAFVALLVIGLGSRWRLLP